MQARLLERGVQGVYVREAMVWHYVPEERCSPKWVLWRAYRDGIRDGMRYTAGVATVLGIPRWIVRQWLKKGFDVLIRLTWHDLRANYHAYYRFCYLSGYIRGSRIARTPSPHVVSSVKL